MPEIEFMCQVCNGTGEGQVDGSHCHSCKGSCVARDHEAEADREAEVANFLMTQDF